LLIASVVIFTTGYHGLVMAQKDANDDIDKAEVNELTPEMMGEHASKLLSRINDKRTTIYFVTKKGRRHYESKTTHNDEPCVSDGGNGVGGGDADGAAWRAAAEGFEAIR
jgi:hypothetical protein